LAAQLVPHVCDDDQALQALEMLPRAQRLPLIRGLRKKRRIRPIDAFLSRLAAIDDPSLTELLPYGSAEAVAAHLEAAALSAGSNFWSRLAHHHPELAVAALEDRIVRMEDED